MAYTSVWPLLPLVTAVLTLVGCGHADQPASPTPAAPAPGFRIVECNGVTDADVAAAISSPPFKKVVSTDVGCFWQESTAIGTAGMGMGISTWWYRGSDMDVERSLEQRAGRALTELAVNGNKGFKASDKNACSIYVAKGQDVITWSIQTLNPSVLPDLCKVTERLAQLSQDRVN
jgi:hypothetical protein